MGMAMMANCSKRQSKCGLCIRVRTCQTNTMLTAIINKPAIFCSSALHGTRHPVFLLKAFSHACWSCVLSGNGQAMSLGLVKPQQLNVSWIFLMASASFCLNSVCQRALSPQSRPDGGAACVPRRVPTTVEYIKMMVLAMMTSGGRWISPRPRCLRRS